MVGVLVFLMSSLAGFFSGIAPVSHIPETASFRAQFIDCLFSLLKAVSLGATVTGIIGAVLLPQSP